MPTTKKHTENDILNFIQQQILHKNNKISCPPLFFLDLTKASTRAAAALQVVIPSNTTLRQLRNICQQVLCHSKRECSFISVAMEGSTGNSLSCKKTSDHNDVNKSTADIATSSVFVNHAEIAWQLNRRKWIGDQSQKFKRMPKDPIISWSTTYEDLLCNDEPFPEAIPLSEMVDFLVDIWQDDGLYD
ncbi:uncharacterized protein LOC131318671 isoform X2 [Rhododendron vialii]|uniref:uncharacterized protein LOC131318671 isoform X2 n=1 Tax=Rhododendron vialii TaxID=182163 RepID=UPI00265F5FD4|nr:uncharacterized protein LOC131318671 isoform X2 [Rhododendron vialii]